MHRPRSHILNQPSSLTTHPESGPPSQALPIPSATPRDLIPFFGAGRSSPRGSLKWVRAYNTLLSIQPPIVLGSSPLLSHKANQLLSPPPNDVCAFGDVRVKGPSVPRWWSGGVKFRAGSGLGAVGTGLVQISPDHLPYDRSAPPTR